MKRLTLTLGPIVLAAVLAACSGTSAAVNASAVPAGSPPVTLSRSLPRT